MARKKKKEPIERIHEELQPTAPKEHKYYFAVTEDEYDAHREELEKMDNIIVFIDDADMDCWFNDQWRIGLTYLEDDL